MIFPEALDVTPTVQTHPLTRLKTIHNPLDSREQKNKKLFQFKTVDRMENYGQKKRFPHEGNFFPFSFSVWSRCPFTSEQIKIMENCREKEKQKLLQLQKSDIMLKINGIIIKHLITMKLSLLYVFFGRRRRVSLVCCLKILVQIFGNVFEWERTNQKYKF